MKGLLFTELLEMVEEDFGYSTANSIILHANLSSKGIYTAARTYHRREMTILFEQLQQQTKLPFDKLSQAFGKHLCKRILIAYPQHRTYINRIFAAITRRTQSPVFEYVQSDSKSLTVVYNPARNADCITEGIIKGYLEYLYQLSRVQETVMPDGRIKFIISFI